MELNRNPDNYFAEIEQAAFSSSNVVPGIGHSPDKMLQARIFSYADAHRYRLGTHYEALPVNQPKCPVHHYHKDGAMRFFRNDTGNPDAYYEPNAMNGPQQDPSVAEPPLQIDGAAHRYDHRAGNHYYSQPAALFRLMTADSSEEHTSELPSLMRNSSPVFCLQKQKQHKPRNTIQKTPTHK